jgi:hypothetical protein
MARCAASTMTSPRQSSGKLMPWRAGSLWEVRFTGALVLRLGGSRSRKATANTSDSQYR